ncbi:MAG: hypothetical protein IKT46_10160 [Clostridia bacterium]|nr:hypothetical protein [Clostridia bacterium]
MLDKIKGFFKKALLFIFNPKLLLCIGIAWFITNGWSYVMFGFGTYFGIGWMIAVSSAYLAFLWLPVSPEKIATAAIAIALLRILFPKDQKTLAVLRQMYEAAKKTIKIKKTR